MVTIWHNPRCSKSRQTLALLEEHDQDIEVFKYLDEELNAQLLEDVLVKLGIGARSLLRKGESAYKELGLKDKAKADSELVAAMVSHPKLIERPIVINGDVAALGRPPESVLEILD